MPNAAVVFVSYKEILFERKLSKKDDREANLAPW